ncbi:MAG: hypothetical protein V2I74_03740 [Erythrobacter sp.]|jgi:hypothetical protein|nr:hypothetical protein [Erythrobacter sp.]
MNTTIKSFVWAGAIIAAAIFAKSAGFGDGESSALIIGLVAAAWASINVRQPACVRECH